VLLLLQLLLPVGIDGKCRVNPLVADTRSTVLAASAPAAVSLVIRCGYHCVPHTTSLLSQHHRLRLFLFSCGHCCCSHCCCRCLLNVVRPVSGTKQHLLVPHGGSSSSSSSRGAVDPLCSTTESRPSLSAVTFSSSRDRSSRAIWRVDRANDVGRKCRLVS